MKKQMTQQTTIHPWKKQIIYKTTNNQWTHQWSSNNTIHPWKKTTNNKQKKEIINEKTDVPATNHSCMRKNQKSSNGNNNQWNKQNDDPANKPFTHEK